MPEISDWPDDDNMIGEGFRCGDDVMAIHARQVGDVWQYAVTRWWYRRPVVLAVFQDNRMLWTED